MRVLVTGGAGYIGSFMTKRLVNEGHDVVVLDSLENGHREAIDEKATFVQGNTLDKKFLNGAFEKYSFDAVFHFAAYISMGESMEKPGMYFENNVFGTVQVLEAMANHNVKTFIFSSTAGIYGNPKQIPIPEDHPKHPTNPYGESKLFVEKILHWYHVIHGINFACLRYFNAAGAALDGSLGEDHTPETHIIPNIINAVLNNEEFTLFGTDHNTDDGTCIRDYIHVLDLVEAHMLSLKKLQNEKGALYYNVGTGKGYSNKEVIEIIKKVSSSEIKIKQAERRPGDAQILVANPDRIKKDMGFLPKYSDLETIIITAWEWHRKNSRPKDDQPKAEK